MGTPEFAVASLEKIISEGFCVVGVVTAPDKPAGRGLLLREPPVKTAAKKHGLPVWQPENLKDPSFLSQLQALNADVFVVVAFRMLPEAVWKMPPKGTFNLHASLLPQYRGAAPIHWAVINGEKETGVTTFFISHDIDTGNIIFQEKVPIADDDTAGTLHDKLMHVGAALVCKTLRAIEAGNCPSVPQSQIFSGPLRPAPKLFRENCRIDWQQECQKIHHLVRGLNPFPGAWTELITATGEKYTVKLFDTLPASLPSSGNKAGTIVPGPQKELMVATGTTFLQILSLQMEGRKKLSAEEFLRGFHHIENAVFQ